MFQRHLKLRVTNFGPIAEASIDLRPLSVFIGPSNTGKSYLAILVYALHQFFSGYPIRLGPDSGEVLYGPQRFPHLPGMMRWYPSPRSHRSPDAISKDIVQELVAWSNQISATMAKSGRNATLDEGSLPVPEVLASLVRPELGNVGDFGQFVDKEISRCFGIGDTQELSRFGSTAGPSVAIKRPLSDYPDCMESFAYEFSLEGKETRLDASIPSHIPLHTAGTSTESFLRGLNNVLDSLQVEEEEFNPTLTQLKTFLRQSVEAYTFNPLHRVAHYLPADRAGVMHAHRVVTGSLIARASRVSLQQGLPLPALSGVLTDFLEQLIEFSDLPTAKSRARNRRLADWLEQDILHGAIEVEKSVIDYPSFSYRPKGWKTNLPLLNTSSMVTELAPVVLYLRHLVHPGDVLIIEEPEAHLHPAAQAEFTKLLARAVRSGVRVIMTTHSEWILEQISNLVELSHLPADKRESLVGTRDWSLRPEQVGVWLFDSSSSEEGTRVENIPFALDGGFEQTGFEQVAESLYHEWTEISDHVPLDGSQ